MANTNQTVLGRTTGPAILLTLLAMACSHQNRAVSAHSTAAAREETPASQQVAGARTSAQREERATDAQRVIDESARAVQRISAGEGAATFERYMTDAKGVFIFPDVKKGALLVGGSAGRGVLLAKTSDGALSTPAFFSLSSASVGLQLGYDRSTVVLFVMNEQALDSALNGGFQLGANASVATGTLAGEGSSADAVAAADVISIAESNGGLYAGVSVKGAVIDPIQKLNASYYGKSAAPREIVTGTRYSNFGAESLMKTLAGFSRGESSGTR